MSYENLKKILFILPNLNGGGAERVAVTYLRQLDLDKYDVTLAVFNKTEDLLGLIPEAVTLIDLGTNSTIKSFRQLTRVLRHLKPDIVYTTQSRVAVLLMLIKPLSPKFQHLARMQNTPSLEKKYGEYGSVVRGLYASGFKSADFVIAQTKEMKDDAIKIFHIPSQKITVLHNPVDTDTIDKCVESTKSPFSGEQVVAVASGRINRQKGFDILLQALPKVVELCPNFCLYILGDDRGALAEIEELIERLKLQRYVNLVGFVDNPYQYYKHCDIFILSSRFEGFPNALLENYYLNTPVVTTKCVPIVEQLIIEGENGYLCEVEDVDCLAEKILKCIEFKRNNIKNKEYSGSKLEELFQ